MTKQYWRTTSKTPRRQSFQAPTGRQAGWQLAVVLAIGVLWGALLAGFVGSTPPVSPPEPAGTSPVASAASATAAASAVAEATHTPNPSPNNTNTLTPLPTATLEPGFTTEPTVTIVHPTPTLTPTPLFTETPLPPPDTPLAVEEPVQISFAGDVLPIFDRRCFNCHGGEKMENDFSVQTHESVLKGSWNGPVIQPGDPDDSYLVELIESGEMPNRGPRLLPAEIAAIRAWIEAGAPDN